MKKISIIIIVLIFVVIVLISDITIKKVDGISMYPTIKDSQHIIVSRIGFVNSGDLVLVHFVYESKNEYFIKRLIAKEGHTVKINEGVIYIDNSAKSFGPNVKWSENNNFSINGKPYTVPKGYAFVLGDNRNVSKDSRDFGVAKIVGKVIFIY